jgi:predicted CXXCH cytochrome family protein
MRRYFFALLILIGFSLLIVTATSLTHALAQGNDDEREYIGARECAECHRELARDHEESAHSLALFESRDDEFVVADFEAGEDMRTIQFPGEDEPTTVTLDDIAFVMGSGRYVQRFVYEVDRDEYVVLPVEWNSVSGEWQPYGPVDNFPDDPTYDFGFSCAGCHTTGLNVRRVRWEDNGVQCEACHGPGSIHADEADGAGRNPSDRELRDIRGAIVRSPDPEICGQCHVRGMEPDDNHPYPIDYIPGGENDLLDEDVFVRVAADDPVHWWASGHARLGNMQFNEWLKSAHASSLETMKGSTAAEDDCLQCHSGDYRFTQALIQLVDDGEREGDPPDPITLETAQFGVTCITCHNPHVQNEDVDFNLVSEPYALCVDCHTNTEVTPSLHHPVQQMFEGQTMVEAVEGIPGIHFSAEDGPDCLTCHMSRVSIGDGTRATHLFLPVLPGATEEGQSNTCETCHDGLTETDLQYLVEDTQATVQNRLSLAFSRLGSVERPEEGSPAVDQYAQVLTALTFVQNDGSFGVHNYDYAAALLDFAERGLSELAVPGAVLEPTEGPAPTATPSGPVEIYREPPGLNRSGIRPAGIILLGLAGLVVIAGAVTFFYYFAQDKE